MTPPYVHQEFPKYLFHATERPRLVQTAEQQAAMGPDWFESAGEAKAAAEAKAIADAAAAAGDPAPAHAPAQPAPAPDAERQGLWKAPADEVIKAIAGASRETLERARAYEVEHPKYVGGRKSVLEAIDAALAKQADAQA